MAAAVADMVCEAATAAALGTRPARFGGGVEGRFESGCSREASRAPGRTALKTFDVSATVLARAWSFCSSMAATNGSRGALFPPALDPLGGAANGSVAVAGEA